MSTTDARKKAKQRAHFVWQEMVAARSDLRPSFKIVAWVLALHRNIETGRCDPAYGTLAKEASVSERTAKRAIVTLERLGFIKVTRTRGGAENERNRYRLLIPEGVAVQTPLKGCQGVSGGVAPVSPKHEVEHGVREHAPAPASAGRKAEEAASQKYAPPAIKQNGAAWSALREIWQRPHVENQEADHAAWVEACDVVAPEVIIDGAQAWVEAFDEPRYLPSLVKWLGARGWEKEPPKRGRGNREKSAAEYAWLAGHYPDGTPRDGGSS